MGILAASVIFTVIMRYFFSLNWKELSEFNITLFAFTTFWGMGINVLRNEHVVIDILYDRVKPAVKRWLAVFNYLVVLAVDLLFTYYGAIYVQRAGMQLSMGMEIPMRFMYGIMPLSGVLCAVCILLKIIGFITAPVEAFLPQNTSCATKEENS
ncbi:MAG: TRAP transporter small permease [Clostridiales bacterium]|nr:TRAP transporter small permease [Clostridiales bacterium]